MDPALSSLVAELFATIQFLSGYAPPTVPPDVYRVPQVQIREQFCHGQPCQIKAIYDSTLGVFLDETLDVHGNVFARSILLHELVHHVQATSGKFDLGNSQCARRNASEQEAYYVQNLYLVQMNDGHRVSMTGWASRCDDGEVPTPAKR